MGGLEGFAYRTSPRVPGDRSRSGTNGCLASMAKICTPSSLALTTGRNARRVNPVAPLHCASAAEEGEAEDERKNTAAVLTMMFGVCVNRIGDDAPLRDAPRATQLADLGQRLRRQSRAELRIAGSLLAVRSSGRTAARGLAAVNAR